MREKREAAKLTLKTVAEKLGISAPYLSDLETGRRSGWSEDLKARYLAILANTMA